MEAAVSVPTLPLQKWGQNLESKCLLFPSYALRESPDPNADWLLRIKGRTFSKGKPSRANKLALGVFRRVAKVERGCQEFSSLEERLGMFFDGRCQTHKLTVDILGITSPGEMVLEGELADEPESFLDDFPWDPTDATQQPLSSRSASTSGSSYPSTPEASQLNQVKYTTGVVAKAGHFNASVYISERMVKEWSPASGCDGKPRRSLVIQAYDGSSNSPATGRVQLIDPIGVSVISDIDDTIKDSGVFRGKKHLLRATFLHACRAVPGMAEVYRMWAGRGASFHYVSNAPWQLYPMLETFFDNFGFPSGSSHLKLFEWNRTALFYEPQGAKRASIHQLLNDFPCRKFILVGDSGEMDLELYTAIARAYPNQIIRIFIRDVTTAGLLGHTEISPPASSSTTKSKLPRSDLERWKGLKGIISRDPNPKVPPSPPSVSSVTQFNGGLHLERSGSAPATDSPSSDSTPRSANAQLAAQTKLQGRVSQATRGLSPSLVTLFTSPASLRDCPVVQSFLPCRNN
ncbi:hypothetical protein L0F63_001627 [Massospora cicadina]|nr:hypothetical protein L0F63_001627 [Massospora cicadina]